ncbi:hypothetical protein [Mesorhizobium sp.]|uniref:hypothetical protein n=1 Tax=Mesorhizobium sp. TaxID=1871066 RepID=UPI000FE5BDD3|nr:hypothetical protein [Mesorhizobium sp.]RWP30225.1 MAG: hypothetical protein EOR03_24800 [Mesorhizobium sp.]TIL63717.1 MAG: hypothetical protein E5Y77_30485 [Mesorhizobium sp.]
MGIDGVYSVVASGPAGGSAGVISISNGQIIGNDTSAARYGGTASREPDGSVKLNVTMMTPPGVFHIWSGTTGETFQTRSIQLTVPGDAFDNGKAVEVPSYSMVVVFRQIPADFGVFAGEQGISTQINNLQAAAQAWASHAEG